MTEPISVLIVDDQALVRGGFRVLIETEPDMTVVGEAGDGLAAVELARATHPDVILLDIQMPGMDGLEALRLIGSDADLASTRVLVLTTFDDDEYLLDALALGAKGFLLKNTDPAQLLHGIRLVAGGEELLSAGLSRRLVAYAAARPGGFAVNNDVFGQLTQREREVVALVAQGLNNDEITARLHISLATTKTHVSRALTKLGAGDRARLVALAYQHGLVDPPSR